MYFIPYGDFPMSLDGQGKGYFYGFVPRCEVGSIITSPQFSPLGLARLFILKRLTLIG
jgi:hypothetical protein